MSTPWLPRGANRPDPSPAPESARYNLQIPGAHGGLMQVPVPHSNAIPRLKLDQLTIATFYREYVRQSRPVHLTQTIGSWRAHGWTTEYLCNKVGHKRVKLSYNRNSTFDYNAESATGSVTIKVLPFADALELIHSDQGSNYYIQQQDMKTEFPELLPDIGRPALMNEWMVTRVTNIWIGGKGCRTPLHFDRTQNFLVQVSGTKRISLFPPQQSCNLYPAENDILEHCSRVNAFAPDFAAYPLFREAEQHKSEVTLQPGDTLFIPNRWWHAVESVEPSISVNFWWNSPA